jgi:ferric-dicitrate binding protein FerR (iron transport regulator)
MSSHNSSHDEKKTIKETLLDQAAAWEGKLDSGEMSENERLDLNAWLNEPRNARALSEVRTLTALIEELPEKKAQTLRRIPLKTTFLVVAS